MISILSSYTCYHHDIIFLLFLSLLYNPTISQCDHPTQLDHVFCVGNDFAKNNIHDPIKVYQDAIDAFIPLKSNNFTFENSIVCRQSDANSPEELSGSSLPLNESNTCYRCCATLIKKNGDNLTEYTQWELLTYINEDMMLTSFAGDLSMTATTDITFINYASAKLITNDDICDENLIPFPRTCNYQLMQDLHLSISMNDSAEMATFNMTYTPQTPGDWFGIGIGRSSDEEGYALVYEPVNHIREYQLLNHSLQTNQDNSTTVSLITNSTLDITNVNNIGAATSVEVKRPYNIRKPYPVLRKNATSISIYAAHSSSSTANRSVIGTHEKANSITAENILIVPDNRKSKWCQSNPPFNSSCFNRMPTSKPTHVPTNMPTSAPAINPTIDPTKDPTIDPTKEPSNAPVKSPTDSPTTNPTPAPTDNPTPPTVDPTIDPTTDPTTDPTVDPTIDPTTDPTVHPTFSPTPKPTPRPTPRPIVTTNPPTESPTSPPTQTRTTSPPSPKCFSIDKPQNILLFLVSFGVLGIIMIVVGAIQSCVENKEQRHNFDDGLLFEDQNVDGFMLVPLHDSDDDEMEKEQKVDES